MANRQFEIDTLGRVLSVLRLFEAIYKRIADGDIESAAALCREGNKSAKALRTDIDFLREKHQIRTPKKRRSRNG